MKKHTMSRISQSNMLFHVVIPFPVLWRNGHGAPISTSQDGAHHPLREIIPTPASLHLGKLLLCGAKTY